MSPLNRYHPATEAHTPATQPATDAKNCARGDARNKWPVLNDCITSVDCAAPAVVGEQWAKEGRESAATQRQWDGNAAAISSGTVKGAVMCQQQTRLCACVSVCVCERPPHLPQRCWRP